jgi:hypothetical protein
MSCFVNTTASDHLTRTSHRLRSSRTVPTPLHRSYARGRVSHDQCACTHTRTHRLCTHIHTRLTCSEKPENCSDAYVYPPQLADG